MKTLAAVAVAVMIASAANAQVQNYFSDSARYACVRAMKAAEAYTPALSSPNDGVVESALAHVAMIKLTMPDCELNAVKGVISRIESKGTTEELRYKAWIVRMLMDNPMMFGDVARAGYEDPDALFAALASKMAAHYTSN